MLPRSTSERDALLLRHFRDGERLASIAQEFRVSRQAVQQVVSRHNPELRTRIIAERRAEDERVAAEQRATILQTIKENPGRSRGQVEALVGRKLTADEAREFSKVLATPKDTSLSVDPARVEEILSHVRWAAEHEHPRRLSGARYDELSKGRSGAVSLPRLFQLFGSWTEACKRAGVQELPKKVRTYTKNWTYEDIVRVVRRFLDDPSTMHGTAREYDLWSRSRHDAPSMSTARNLAPDKSWAGVKRDALRVEAWDASEQTMPYREVTGV